jgi:hypothetical protein
MIGLQPVDAVEVTLVVDSYVGILAAGADGVRRFPLAFDFFDHEQLVAGPTWRPRAWRWWRSAAPSCCWTTRC